MLRFFHPPVLFVAVLLLPVLCPLTFSGQAQIVLQVQDAYPVGNHPASVIAADFNEDGWPDLVTSNLNSGDITILLNLEGSGLGEAQSFPAGAGPLQLAAGDINEDGHLDVVTANSWTDMSKASLAFAVISSNASKASSGTGRWSSSSASM